MYQSKRAYKAHLLRQVLDDLRQSYPRGLLNEMAPVLIYGLIVIGVYLALILAYPERFGW